MDRRYKEKLSHLNDLYQLANLDGRVSEVEETYIRHIAKALGVNGNDLDSVIQSANPWEFTPPQHEYECIPQFHRLMLLLSLHRRYTPPVRMYIRNIALRMGLNLLAVEEIFLQMERAPKSNLTPAQISNIFKKYYN